MKYLIIIVFTVSVNCFLPSQTQTKSEKAQDRWTTLYVYCFAMYNAWTRVTTVTDNKDGTVRILVEGVNPCGGRKFASETFLKKCIQGQVYRQSQNDCKGTGTAADYYGAQKFQWCSTNDESCNASGSTYSVDVNKSPAAISCEKEITGNKKWSLLTAFDTIEQRYLNEFIKREEFPDDAYWTYLGDTLTADAVYLSNIKVRTERSKDSFLYVLCMNHKQYSQDIYLFTN